MLEPEELLAPLRQAGPRTPSTVSVPAAIRAGTRRRRVRQLAGTAVVAVVTVLIALLVPALLGGLFRAEPARPAVGFDPLRQAFRVGSAGGFTPVSYETGRDRQRIRLVRADGSPGLATITLSGSGPAPAGEAAPAVHGRRAVWSGDGVAWEWTDGAWGLVGGVPDREQAHRVAQSVESGAGTPVRLPFEQPRPVPPDEVLGVISPYGSTERVTDAVLLVLGRPGATEAERVLVGTQGDLGRDPVTGQSRQAPRWDTELGGRQAAVTGTAVLIAGTGGGPAAVALSGSVGGQRLAELAQAVR
ncbi:MULTISPECIES: hypothetical protein [unclassified Crossiella]|uniref:hypothetical protein n=1 Tax=unclassified Crossiella TaxID=2620835 RepID=UPI001FFFE3DA|nr:MULTISPECIES: hypothetical protein [unclassified Crossiella]MCK2241378.1 hypothetical protein [Crossiella sp. S99.2]MCK2253478.1 hypothetical protein [Crossiella sp. S99.1]